MADNPYIPQALHLVTLCRLSRTVAFYRDQLEAIREDVRSGYAPAREMQRQLKDAIGVIEEAILSRSDGAGPGPTLLHSRSW